MNMALFNYLNNFAGKSKFLDFFILFSAEYFWYLLVITLAAVLFFEKTKNRLEKTYWFVSALLAGAAARVGIAEIIRYFYHHPRPNGTALFLETSSSFPSGHTIFIFAFATVVYFYNKKLGCWFGMTGILIGFSRVAAGVHWPFDILGGIVFGILTGLLVHKSALLIRKKTSQLAIKS